jgi:hypothetical protein
MRSIEYQVMEGATGDLIIIPGCETPGGPRIFPSVRIRVESPEWRQWSPTGVWVEHARARVARLGRDRNWSDTLGFRGANEMELPPDQWNRIEIECEEDTLRFHLNGTIVNAAESSTLREGKVMIQSEGAEIFYRRIEVQPLRPGK